MFVLKYNMPPVRWRLFLFISLNIIHAFLLLFIFKNILFSLLILIDLIYYFYLKNSIFILLRFLYFSLIIFVLNIFFYDGEIVFKLAFLKITKESLYEGGRKSLFLLGLLFLTINALKKNKDFFIYELDKKGKNKLLSKSINYFFLFIEKTSGKKGVKNFSKNILTIYKKDGKNELKRKSKEIKVNKDFFIYQIFFYLAAFVFIIFIRI
jgi:hypothetical protein